MLCNLKPFKLYALRRELVRQRRLDQEMQDSCDRILATQYESYTHALNMMGQQVEMGEQAIYNILAIIDDAGLVFDKEAGKLRARKVGEETMVERINKRVAEMKEEDGDEDCDCEECMGDGDSSESTPL